MVPALVPLSLPVVLPNQSHACPSCRVDWLSATFQLHQDDDLDDLADYLADLGDRVLSGGRFLEPGKGRFYETKLRHESGLQLQYTLPSRSASACRAQDSRPVVNSGLASVEVPGSIWGFLDPKERSRLITEVRHWPALKRVTRLDLEATLLDPVQDAEAVVLDVAAGRLWPVGFGIGMAYANRNLHGDLHGACTQYFGGKASRIRSRHYDKAAEAGWQTEAVRHEVQLREEPADQWFRRLADRCETEQPVGPLLMTAEAATVKDALGTLVDFRDTSRWEGQRKPKKWAQTARPPGWWRDVVGPAPTPLAVEYRPPGGLEASLEAMFDQYGRKLGLWAFLACLDTGDDVHGVGAHVVLRAMTQLDEGDWKLIAQLRPELDEASLRDCYLRSIANAKAWADCEEPEEVAAPPC
jgi:hypothetical protein